MVDVRLTTHTDSPVLIEGSASIQEETRLRIEDALVLPNDEGVVQMTLWNPSGISQSIEEGREVGLSYTDYSVQLNPKNQSPLVQYVSADVTSDDQRSQLFLQQVPKSDLPPQERDQLLKEHNDTFSLEAGERRMPFSVHQEVARLLEEMQENGVIQPSESPWASPIVLVRKKDGSHRFCVDYRRLNTLTKSDTYPLPRIDDLLDKLGGAKYFSTLDLASGFWQVRVHPASIEKTAFLTPHGLYEFRVMPFGLCNAPSVFQRLMNRVVSELNPSNGKEFVSVYIDNLLVYSKTLSEHLIHLSKVLGRLREVNLMLKPGKCHFARKEVQYLGHVLTPDGVKPNQDLVKAVECFPAPKDLKGVRRFLGMSSYYRKFIPQFSKVAEPLHKLIRKDTPFDWSPECEAAFKSLKGKLIAAPILAYPSFEEPFLVETDASIEGLGTVLSQKQSDGQQHPIAFASRSFNPAEKNYSIT